MKPGLVVTDLDGTLLEPHGQLVPEAAAALSLLRTQRVPFCPVTSKTAAELHQLAPLLGPWAAAGVENGGGWMDGNGELRLVPEAVPWEELLSLATHLRQATGVPLRTLPELSDQELAALTGLPPAQLPAVRNRRATCPLLVEPSFDAMLRRALPPGFALLRGNRFLHLQGTHNKASVLPTLRAACGRPRGPIVALGDAPNDAALLQAADIAVVVPGSHGPCVELLHAVPQARVAPFPHGRGWAASICSILQGEGWAPKS